MNKDNFNGLCEFFSTVIQFGTRGVYFILGVHGKAFICDRVPISGQMYQTELY